MEIDGAAAGAPPATPQSALPPVARGSRDYSSGSPSRGDTRVGSSSRWRGVGDARSSGGADGR